MSNIARVELDIVYDEYARKTHMRYGVDSLTALTPTLIAEINKDFVKRTVERLVEEHYIDIVKNLDMAAIERLITLEVARQTAGIVREGKK